MKSVTTTPSAIRELRCWSIPHPPTSRAAIVGSGFGRHKLPRARHGGGAAHQIVVPVLDLPDHVPKPAGVAIGLGAVRVLHRFLVRGELDPDRERPRPIAVLHDHRLPVADRAHRVLAPLVHEGEQAVFILTGERQRLNERHGCLLSGRDDGGTVAHGPGGRHPPHVPGTTATHTSSTFAPPTRPLTSSRAVAAKCRPKWLRYARPICLDALRYPASSVVKICMDTRSWGRAPPAASAPSTFAQAASNCSTRPSGIESSGPWPVSPAR